MKTLRITDNMEQAAALIRAGGLVAVPTETVYGLAGNGLDPVAVEKIYEVKGRPARKPLSLMVPDESAMEQYCTEVPGQAHILAQRFWPGPLTIILKAKESVPPVVTADGRTLGLRCPDHPLTHSLLEVCALPLAAPSANPSGAPSPKNAEEVLEYFDGKIDAVIDGGPCGIGIASTIVDMSAEPYRILRRGALGEKEIADALADRMCLIGITGGSGCGKTTALEALREMGALILDCDEIYHELLEHDPNMLSALREAFPDAFSDKGLDRKKLGGIVFDDGEKLRQLNGITHSFVNRAVEERLRLFAMEGGSVAAIDAVELWSAGLGEKCRATVAILSDRESRIARIMARDSISRGEAEARLSAQKPDGYYLRSCSHVLFNNADRGSFLENCRQLFKEIIQNGRPQESAIL